MYGVICVTTFPASPKKDKGKLVSTGMHEILPFRLILCGLPVFFGRNSSIYTTGDGFLDCACFVAWIVLCDLCCLFAVFPVL